MKSRPAVYLFLFALFFSCHSGTKESSYGLGKIVEPEEVIQYHGGEILITDFDGLQGLLEIRDGRTHVINFWASWCKPCIQELPYFLRLQQHHDRSELQVIMVSLDFRSKVEETLIPFLESREFILPLILLHDPAANEWIDRVDPSWTGSIPATLIFNNERREFYEKEFTEEELNSIVQNFLN